MFGMALLTWSGSRGIGSGCNQVRNCGLGLHVDQTAEVVCIQATFYFKGLVFPIRMLWDPDCIAEKANKRQLGNITESFLTSRPQSKILGCSHWIGYLWTKKLPGLLKWPLLVERFERKCQIIGISQTNRKDKLALAPKWVPILGSGSPWGPFSVFGSPFSILGEHVKSQCSHYKMFIQYKRHKHCAN